MLDPFEARFADLFADRLAGTADLALPVRAAPAAPPAAGVLPVLRVTQVRAAAALGDDAPRVRRFPGGVGLRTVLELAGSASVDLLPAAALPHQAVLQALDAVLVALQAEDVRSGAAFADGTDQGFLLRGFRLREALVAAEGVFGMRAVFDFQGEFWPVRPEADGPAIAVVPTRIAVLPAAVPERLSARAGGPDLVVPVALDLRSLGAGPAALVARLQGAAPPGSLQGPPATLPGYTAYPVDAAGVARIVFRPAAAVAATAQAGIELALAGNGRPTVALAGLRIAVLP